MKVKAINRSEQACTRERSSDLLRVHRNLDPALRPHEKEVEYTRALNAAKLQRVFAKPFLGSLPHDEGVTCLARNPAQLNSLVSGAADGVVRLWDIAGQRCLRRLEGHTAAVRGASIAPNGTVAVSCSTDCTVRLWKLPYAPFISGTVEESEDEIIQFQGPNGFTGIDHHWQENIFATSGAQVDIWSHERSRPTATFSWGADTVQSVRFNPAEPDILVTTGSDRAVTLYDLRSGKPIRKLIMQTRTNSVAWNPMEAFNFTAASEDCNLYSFDMRQLKQATCVHQDFVSAVMDVDYSPTGREFVAGSYDRSVRVFPHTGGHSRDVYHTKRMQRVFAVRFSGDGSYVFSGSDDMNVRIWKADASQQLGTLLPRERQKAAYDRALIERHKHLPEIGRIARHRHLPTSIYKASKQRRQIIDNDAKKERRRIAHSAPGSRVVKPARKRKIIAEEE